MFHTGGSSDVAKFLEKNKLEREKRHEEQKQVHAAIHIQKTYRGWKVRCNLQRKLRTEWSQFLGIQSDNEFTPQFLSAEQLLRNLPKLQYKYQIHEDRWSLECLCRHLMRSFEATNIQQTFVGPALNKDLIAKWRSQTRWVCVQAMQHLETVDINSPRDIRFLNVVLSLFVIVFHPPRWNFLRQINNAALMNMMVRMMSSILEHLLRGNYYTVIKRLLTEGLVSCQNGLSEITRKALFSLALLPVELSASAGVSSSTRSSSSAPSPAPQPSPAASNSPDVLSLPFLLNQLIFNVLSLPGMVSHAKSEFAAEHIGSLTLSYLYGAEESRRAVYGQLQTPYLLCLVANLIELAVVEKDILESKRDQFCMVLADLLLHMNSQVARKKSRTTHWHCILGWFSQPVDKCIQDGTTAMLRQLHLLWSENFLHQLFREVYSNPQLERLSTVEMSSPSSSSSNKNSGGFFLFGRKRKSLLLSFSTSSSSSCSQQSGKHSSNTGALLDDQTLAASLFYLQAANTMREIRNDILGGLTFDDLLPRLWHYLRSTGMSTKDFAKLLAVECIPSLSPMSSLSSNKLQSSTSTSHLPSPGMLHALHIFTWATANVLVILDDMEVFEKQIVFSVEDLTSMADFLKLLVYHIVLLTREDPHVYNMLRAQYPRLPAMEGTVTSQSFSSSSAGRHSSKSSAKTTAPDSAALLAPTSQQEISTKCDNAATVFASCLQLLDVLYQRHCRRPFTQHEDFWIIKEIKMSSFLSDLRRQRPYATLIVHLIPFVIARKERVIMFRELVKGDRHALGIVSRSGWSIDESPPGAIITVSRQRIVEDGYQQLAKLSPREMKMKIRVRFVNALGLDEVGLDLDGVFKEFLEESLRRVFDPQLGLFRVTSEEKLYPSPYSLIQEHHLHLFEFLGRLLGKAVYEGIIVDVHFADFFLTQMLGKERNGLYSCLDELFTLDRDLYKSLTFIKHYDGDVTDLELTFSYDEDCMGKIVTHDLIPAGRYTPVTNDNKISYVHQVAHFRMYRQIREQSRAFIRGFTSIIPPAWLAMFSPAELQKLIAGDTLKIDVDELKQHVHYSGGFHAGHKVISWLWDILKNEFTEQEKSLFLKFVTSCSKPPLLGFAYLEPPITIRCVQYQTEDMDVGDTVGTVLKGFFGLGSKRDEIARLPTASTCFNLLKLPNYQNKSTLKEKLRYAIHSNAGFELS